MPATHRRFYRKPRFWRTLAVQLLLLVLLYAGLQAWQGRGAISGVAPPVAAMTLDGRRVSLAEYRGQPLLLHFWASWCPVCRFEQPVIEAIAADYPVLTIASQSGSSDEVASYVEEQGIGVAVIVDEEGAWARLYRLRGFPTTVIIRPDGTISDVEIGYTSGWGLRLRLWLATIGA